MCPQFFITTALRHSQMGVIYCFFHVILECKNVLSIPWRAGNGRKGIALDQSCSVTVLALQSLARSIMHGARTSPFHSSDSEVHWSQVGKRSPNSFLQEEVLYKQPFAFSQRVNKLGDYLRFNMDVGIQNKKFT